MMHQAAKPFLYPSQRTMPESISVLIGNYNHSRFIQALVYRLAYWQSIYPKHLEVIISDSGSNETNQQIIKDMLAEMRGSLRMKYIYLDKSAERKENPRFNGYAFCVNAGAREAQGDVLIHCDSSILVSPTYPQAMSSPHMERERLFVRAGLTNHTEEHTQRAMQEEHYKTKSWDELVADLGKNPRFSLGRPAWSVTKQAFEDVGGMDESMQTYGAIDDDFVTRLMLLGYENVQADVFVIHQFHTEDRKSDGTNERKMRENIKQRKTKVKTSCCCDKMFSNFQDDESWLCWYWINGASARVTRRNMGIWKE